MRKAQLTSYAKAFLGITHGESAFGGPIQASILLMNKCNIRCVHCCYYSPYLKAPLLRSYLRAKKTCVVPPKKQELQNILNQDADIESIRHLVDELIKMGTWRFELCGHGEPFLYKHFLELSERLKKHDRSCFTDTNGTLIDRDIADDLIRIKFDELRVTTMAGSAEIYARTHPGSPETLFDTVTSNLLYIKEQKASKKVRKPEITLAFVVITENAGDIIKFAEYAVHVGANRVFYRPVDDVNDPGLAKVVPSEEQSKSVLEDLSEVKTYLDSKGISHNINYFRKSFRKKVNTKEIYQTIPCTYGWVSTNIEVNGDVYPCCRSLKPLGNVYKESFSSIWNSRAYKTFRKEAKKINRRKTPVAGCDCYRCLNQTANLRVYKAYHPFKGRSFLDNIDTESSF